MIITVFGSASEKIGSDFLKNKQLLSGYKQMGLSRNLECLKICEG